MNPNVYTSLGMVMYDYQKYCDQEIKNGNKPLNFFKYIFR